MMNVVLDTRFSNFLTVISMIIIMKIAQFVTQKKYLSATAW